MAVLILVLTEARREVVVPGHVRHRVYQQRHLGGYHNSSPVSYPLPFR